MAQALFVITIERLREVAVGGGGSGGRGLHLEPLTNGPSEGCESRQITVGASAQPAQGFLAQSCPPRPGTIGPPLLASGCGQIGKEARQRGGCSRHLLESTSC